MTARRRRGLLLLAVALVSGGLAASEVSRREREVAERLGPVVPVLVATRDLPADARLTGAALALRRVPARFLPPDALGSAAGAVGTRLAVPLPAGAYVTAGALAGADTAGAGPGLRRGERAVTVDAVAGAALSELAPGARVDVLVSSESGRTDLALAAAELLRLEPPAGAPADAADPVAPVADARATLRVTLAQAIALTEADNFAREIRLLARPNG